MTDYVIPLKYRKMENLHIVFWLFKDIGWCLIWKPLGIVMIFPTLIISIVIAWRTRHLMSELCHNLAITFWISANSYWMISEFVKIDALPIPGLATAGSVPELTYKHLALIPFMLGVVCLAFYYLYWRRKHPEEAKTM